MKWFFGALFLLGIVFTGITIPHPADAADIRDIVFPVLGDSRYSNDFGAPRSGGRTHEGIDIIGTKGQPLIAAVDGTVHYVAYPEPYYGYAIFLEDDDGYEYWYLHINNDTPGTDDGLGGGIHAFAPDVVRGNPVTKGQLIGWMGDSGNAESTVSHLHFEIHRTSGNVINPYESLQSAVRLGASVEPPAFDGEILPFGRYQGGASIAFGELNGRYPGQEIIVGAGPGGGPHVRMYAQDGTLLGGFFAYPKTFHGGVNVAAGDFNGDGIDEIVTAVASNGGPQVRIFTADAKVRGQFMAYAETFRGGVNVAAADLNGDGIDEIVTGAGNGGGPHVRVFTHGGIRLSQFFAYAETFRGGVHVAATEATENTPAYIVTGAGNGGGPHVRVFNWRGTLQYQFFAYAETFRGGVQVDIANIDTHSDTPEILTAPAAGGGAQFRMFSYRGSFVKDYHAYETWWRGGYDIAAGDGVATVVNTGGARRTSIRSIVD